jgi:hypothetical protein
VSIHESDGDDDPALGGAAPGSGGRSGTAGSAQGGSGVGATGGNFVGGGTDLGGVPSTGGVPAGGVSGMGPAGAGGERCESGTFTEVVGTVRDPSGRMPLYNVMVAVPSGPLAPVPEGIRCESCGLRIQPDPLYASLTDTQGHFVLQAPPGRNVPLVIQTGKWRREITVPFVTPCEKNVIEDPELLRLPRSQSEGHLPRIAVVTGVEDSLECLLRRLGIADGEFTTREGDGAVNLFVGCNGGSGTGTDRFNAALGAATFPSASELFSKPMELARYDYVLLGCEGSACGSSKDPYLGAIEGYANGGGRLFLDHLQNYWIANGSPALGATATFDAGHESLLQTVRVNVDPTFPKGFALAEWLVNVGASDSRGELVLHDAGASVPDLYPPVQRWLYDGVGSFSMTMNMAIEVETVLQCGRIVYSDFHAWSAQGDLSVGGVGFPNGCHDGPLSPQEAFFSFQLFDISSCVSHGGGHPMPPPL